MLDPKKVCIMKSHNLLYDKIIFIYSLPFAANMVEEVGLRSLSLYRVSSQEDSTGSEYRDLLSLPIESCEPTLYKEVGRGYTTDHGIEKNLASLYFIKAVL